MCREGCAGIHGDTDIQDAGREIRVEIIVGDGLRYPSDILLYREGGSLAKILNLLPDLAGQWLFVPTALGSTVIKFAIII